MTITSIECTFVFVNRFFEQTFVILFAGSAIKVPKDAFALQRGFDSFRTSEFAETDNTKGEINIRGETAGSQKQQAARPEFQYKKKGNNK